MTVSDVESVCYHKRKLNGKACIEGEGRRRAKIHGAGGKVDRSVKIERL